MRVEVRVASPEPAVGVFTTAGTVDAELIVVRNPREQPHPTTVADAGQP